MIEITIRIDLFREFSFVPLSTYSCPSKAQLCICTVYTSIYILFIPVYYNSEVIQDCSIKIQEKQALKILLWEMQALSKR